MSEQQHEHFATAVAVATGRRHPQWRAACTGGCIDPEQVGRHDRRADALDEARSLLREAELGPTDDVWRKTDDGPWQHVHVMRCRVCEPALDATLLRRQREFSERAFGPGPRTLGVLEHITKEIEEVKAAPNDLGEWVDIVILGLDGAWRAGYNAQTIIDAVIEKFERNEARTWPDWRTIGSDHAIEHDRSAE